MYDLVRSIQNVCTHTKFVYGNIVVQKSNCTNLVPPDIHHNQQTTLQINKTSKSYDDVPPHLEMMTIITESNFISSNKILFHVD